MGKIRACLFLDLSEKLIIIGFKGWPISLHTRDSSCNNWFVFSNEMINIDTFKKYLWKNLGKNHSLQNPMRSLFFTIKIQRDIINKFISK